MSAVPTVEGLLQEGLEMGLHLGGQLYVSRAGQPVVDWAFGNIAPDSLMHWFSASKPFAAMAIAQLWERGLLSLDDRVVEYLPEFAAHGKEDITLRHVLTHTGGFRSRVDLEWGGIAWEEAIDRVCAARRERQWVAGRKAGYHIASGWYVLGEIVRRLDGRSFTDYVRAEIFEKLAMDDCWIGMPAERYVGYGERMASVYNTESGTAQEQAFREGRVAAAHCVPGASGRGPARQLAYFYEALLAGGQRQGQRIVSPQAVEALVARQRNGLFDHTFKHVMDWGLGFVVNSSIYGAETVPYGYGHHASPRSYGHSGQQTSVAFADPEWELAVALVVNGMPGPDQHHRRFLNIMNALYDDLELIVDG
ncbi:MAG: CubicO group peptidase (beta-lactamase class C family) [Candidatus Latescibacterota bacterium]|jgi:CubicO group peptidase (beta-lactamase class C family)